MLNKLNINLLLENSKRSDVRGYNIYTCGKKDFIRPSAENPVIEKWDKPSLGLHGMAAIGHEIDKKDIILPCLSVNGNSLELLPVRNRWTPAFMDTYYRSKPFGEYKKSGLIAIREKKCFTENDTFISHLTVYNDGREPITVTVSLSTPFEKVSDSIYSVYAKIMPMGILKEMYLTGFAAASTDRGNCVELTIPAQSNTTLKYGFAFCSDSDKQALSSLEKAFDIVDPFAESEARFNEWMDKNAPALNCNDPDILKIYYYRFFVIKSAIHTPSSVLPSTDYKGQCVYESPFGDWFGTPIGLPIPLQIREMQWMKDTSVLRSNISNWCHGCGVMQGYIQFTPMAIWGLYLQTNDITIVSDCYEAVKDYTLKHGGVDGDPLPITTGSWVTGAEYQPAFYQHVEPKWDWRYDSEGAKKGFPESKLYRIDECVMYAANLIACKNMAALLESSADYESFSSRVDSAVEKMLNIFWNEEKQFFFDADTVNVKSCDEAYGYDGFLPMMFSIFGDKYHTVFDKLRRGERFDSGFALTSVGKDCPMYWFDNCIAGPTASSVAEPHEYSCSWNGPVWPFAVSLVLEALGSAAYSNKSLNDTFIRLFTEYTDLHFDFGDRSTPCICEHYRPTDAISFSPYTEYFHSEWLNLFFSYYLGIRVTKQGVSFDPMTDKEFSVDGIVIKGKTYRISQKKINGKLCSEMSELS